MPHPRADSTPASRRLFDLLPTKLLPPSIVPRPDGGDGFPAYVAAARKAGIDVNDWIEANLGWMPALPILERVVFPLVRRDSLVCEVGVGTGRWSRHILDRIPDGRIVLIDRSEWIVRFLREYFARHRNVRALMSDGVNLPLGSETPVDLVFSQGMFITLKLGHVYMYAREFSRVLKPGGHAVFDFIDPARAEGWSFLEREAPRAYDVFTYHSVDAVSRCCESAGLEVTGTETAGKSTYVIARKRG